LVEPLKARLAAGQATLAICLGLQVLAGSSEESPGSRGLSFLESAVTRIAGEVRIPHIGWNRVGVSAGAGARDAVVRDGYAYYANSFALPSREAAAPLVAAGWRVAETSHGSAFVAAIERGGIVACQFHPELSGAWGLGLMRRWLERAGVTLACAEGVTC
jgi:imidazole glycerol phosphate synthase glutamine amidotransferase subunit